MPIQHIDPPANGVELVEANLGDIIHSTPDHVHGPRGELDNVLISPPHPGYHYGLDDLVAKASLEKAHLGTWNYVVYREVPAFELFGVAQLHVEHDGTVDFHGMLSGTIVQASLDAVAFAEAHDDTQAHRFEMRGLTIPALYFTALWLHREDRTDSAADDLFLPLFDHVDELKTRHFYSWTDIRDRLQDRAVMIQGHGAFF